MFNDFITSLGGQTSAVTVVMGFYAIALSFAGLLSNFLSKKFAMQTVGLIGSGMFFTGSLLTIFVTSVEQLIVTFGIFQGD